MIDRRNQLEGLEPGQNSKQRLGVRYLAGVRVQNGNWSQEKIITHRSEVMIDFTQ